jgi:hypothetical protein
MTPYEITKELYERQLNKWTEVRDDLWSNYQHYRYYRRRYLKEMGEREYKSMLTEYRKDIESIELRINELITARDEALAAIKEYNLCG